MSVVHQVPHASEVSGWSNSHSVLRYGTMMEKYGIDGVDVFVKREDLCVSSDGPPFSKVRGLHRHMLYLKESGITTVGYVETAVSMAGWGVAWVAKQLNMKAVIFAPTFLNPLPIYLYHEKKWREFGAEVIPIDAGMAKVAYYVCKKALSKLYPKISVLLPLGLPFKETVESTAKEYKITRANYVIDNLVCCVGSGTILAGILKGISETSRNQRPTVYGIMCREGNKRKKLESIMGKAGLMYGPLSSPTKVVIIDEGWGYTEESLECCPFPCHPYYDLKAWEWLVKNIKTLKGNTIFWNIGSLPVGWDKS